MNNKFLTPRKDGFFMPAEYAPHEATFMLLPYRDDTWREQGVPAQKVFMEVARVIGEYEKVYIGVIPHLFNEIKKQYNLPNVHLFPIEYDDAWSRDNGPTMVIDNKGNIRGIDWAFNAWGGDVDGRFKPWDLDDKLAGVLLNKWNIAGYRTDNFVFEGGAVNVDGEGLAMVTESCLLSKGRNPHLSKKEIENILIEYLNVKKVLWLPIGIFNDGTNGHVDNIATFVGPGHILIADTDDPLDPQYDNSKACLKYLINQTNINGHPLKITKMIMPETIYRTDNEAKTIRLHQNAALRPNKERLPASYVNFYFVNNAIILPGFNQPSDKIAKQIVASLFPNLEIRQIYSREILLGGGNIHCITQQIPAR
jgi:agmatine deiminase